MLTLTVFTERSCFARPCSPAARFCPAYQHFTGFDDTQSLADVVCVLGEEEYKEAIEALQ